jgi:hypothetical protein
MVYNNPVSIANHSAVTPKLRFFLPQDAIAAPTKYCTLGWVDLGTTAHEYIYEVCWISGKSMEN